MKNSTRENIKFGLFIGAMALAAGYCVYSGMKEKNTFAKYVMEHPEEYKQYQNVEKFSGMESKIKSLENSVCSLTQNNNALSTQNNALKERLKGFVKKEYEEFFDVPTNNA